MKYIIDNEEGLTLLELIIVILIMGVITMVAFRLIDFSLSSYDYGVDQVERQSNLRLAAFNVTGAVRNARELNLVLDESSVSSDEFIWVNNAGYIIHNDEGTELRLSSDLISTLSFSAAPTSSGTYLLTITITDTDGDSLVTDVLLNNITSVASTSGAVVEFTFDP